MIDSQLTAALFACYEMLEGSEECQRYSRLHGIDSLAILTVYDDDTAALIAEHLADRVRGKAVVEIGGGIGLLALYLSQYADRVFVIEANPVWTSVYVSFLHRHKPKNVTFIFGAAQELTGQIDADVAMFCTHSDADGMRAAAERFAPVVIDVYGEVLASMTAPDSSLIFKTMCEMRKAAVA